MSWVPRRGVLGLVLAALLVPWAGAQLPPLAPDPGTLVPESPTAPLSGDACADASVCAGHGDGGSDACADPSAYGLDDRTTFGRVDSPLTYTVVAAYEACSSGTWWQGRRGFFVLHTMPGLVLGAGGYTVEFDDVDKTEYYVVTSAGIASADVRWTGYEGEGDTACRTAVALSAASVRPWVNLPCPLPPPAVPESGWVPLVP